ncbi:MAG: LysR family transcriptional regulator, partial [Alphaproteobacteria bacterium]
TLFHRHARGLTLTHEGERLFETTHGFADRLESTVHEINEGQTTPRGPLTVTTTISFGSIWLAHRLPRFFQRYPQMRLHLLLSDEDLNLSSRQAEVGIRFHESVQADLIQRRLLPIQHNLYASKAYIARHGAPEAIEDLRNHPVIAYGANVPLPIQDVNWVLHALDPKQPLEPLLTINNIYGVKQAVLAGIGVAALPEYMARADLGLVHILPELKGPRFQTYLVYPIELKGSLRVLALRDFLLEEIAAGDGGGPA